MTLDQHRTRVQTPGPRDAQSTYPLKRWWPLTIVLVWWAACYGTYAIGWPIQYPRTNFGYVTLLMAAVALGTALGFTLGSRPTPLVRLPSGRLFNWWPQLGAVLGIALLVPTLAARSSYGLGDLWFALTHQAAAYADSTARIADGTQSRIPLLVLLALTAPATMTALPYFISGLVSGRTPNSPLRFWLTGLTLTMLPSLILSVATGRTQQLGLLVLIAGGAYLAAVSPRKKTAPPGLGLAAIVALLLAATLGLRRGARLGSIVLCQPGRIDCPNRPPTTWELLLDTAASYAGQGFEGLGRAMEGTWRFGGGYSHARAIRNVVSGPTDPASGPVTAQLVNNDWSDTTYWSTALTEIANDVPWVLIPVLFVVIGFGWGWVYKVAAINRQWPELTVFAYASLAIFMVPQNFQLGYNGPVYLGFWALIAYVAWRAYRRRAEPST